MNTMIKRVMYLVLGCSLALLFAGQANAGICPAVGVATDCGVQINVTAQSGGVATAFTVGAGPAGNGNPYDGVEDTLVGITNNSDAVINSITLSASSGADAFGFEGDGACTTLGASAGFTCGASGYEGPNMTFSAVTSSGGVDSMTITFTNGGLDTNTSTWFSLEGTPNSLVGGGGIGGPTPEPASLVLLGTGVLGLFLLRRAVA